MYTRGHTRFSWYFCSFCMLYHVSSEFSNHCTRIVLSNQSHKEEVDFCMYHPHFLNAIRRETTKKEASHDILVFSPPCSSLFSLFLFPPLIPQLYFWPFIPYYQSRFLYFQPPLLDSFFIVISPVLSFPPNYYFYFSFLFFSFSCPYFFLFIFFSVILPTSER